MPFLSPVAWRDIPYPYPEVLNKNVFYKKYKRMIEK